MLVKGGTGECRQSGPSECQSSGWHPGSEKWWQQSLKWWTLILEPPGSDYNNNNNRTHLNVVNTLRPRQNGSQFTDDVFKRILNENVCIALDISMKFVPKIPINTIPAMVQIRAWRKSLHNVLFRYRSKNTSNLRVTGFCVGNWSVTGEFTAQWASNAEKVSI